MTRADEGKAQRAMLSRRRPKGSSGWSYRPGLFGVLLGSGVLLWLTLLVAANQLAPSPSYSSDSESPRASSRFFVRPAAISPEPRQPIAWPFVYEVAQQLRVRSSVALEGRERVRIAQLFTRTQRVFPGWAGVAWQDTGGIDVRVVPLATLNDPAYFEASRFGTLYGLYFTRSNVAYISNAPEAADESLVHELAHYYLDEYGMTSSTDLEETRVRHFERFFARYEGLLAHAHVHDQLPHAAAVRSRRGALLALTPEVSIRLTTPLTLRARESLIRRIRIAYEAFPEYTGLGVRPGDTLELRRVPAALLHSEALFGGAAASPLDARYFAESHLLLYTEPAPFALDPLAHGLAHHLIRQSGATLGPEEEELLAVGFTCELERRRATIGTTACLWR